MDNIHLLTELKYAQPSIELLNARYKYGMVLIGMTLLQEPKNFETTGEDVSPSELIYERIRQFTRAISPLLLPMILFVVSVYSYFYEASSMGLLPVINYPLRLYAVPLLILGLLFLSLAIAIYKFFQ